MRLRMFTSPLRTRRPPFGGIESAAVVLDHNVHRRIVAGNPHADFRGVGVLEDVVEGFLHDEEQIVPHLRRQDERGSASGISSRQPTLVFSKNSSA